MNPSSAELSAEKKRELLVQLLQMKARDGASQCPLSYGQQALWFVYQLDPDSSAYNILYAARVRQDVDRAALHRSLQQLTDRHEALRTTYGMTDGVPLARIHA
jgi:hypothetical protein